MVALRVLFGIWWFYRDLGITKTVVINYSANKFHPPKNLPVGDMILVIDVKKSLSQQFAGTTT
jgi:hypothetical protein